MNDSTQLRTFVCRSLTVAVLKRSVGLSPTPTRSKVGFMCERVVHRTASYP